MSAITAGQISGAIAFGQVEKLEAEIAGLSRERTAWLRQTMASLPVSVDPQTWGAQPSETRQRVTQEFSRDVRQPTLPRLPCGDAGSQPASPGAASTPNNDSDATAGSSNASCPGCCFTRDSAFAMTALS